MASFDQIVANLEESDGLIVALEKDVEKLREDIAERLEEEKCGQKELKRIFNRLRRKGENIQKSENDLNKILDAAENSSIEDLQKKIQNDREKLQEIECFDSFFVFVHDLYENLRQSKDKFELNEFSQSNHHLKSVFKLYDKIQQSIPLKNCDPTTIEAFKAVCTSIKSDIDLVQEKFICDFIQIYKNNFTFDSELNMLNCDFNRQLSSNYTSFIECLLEEQANFGVYLENTCSILSEDFLKPILTQNSLPIIITHDGHEYEEYHDDFCAISLRTNAAEPTLDDEQIIENVKHFIKLFLQILTNNFTMSFTEQLSQLVGKTWSTQICESLIKHYFELRLPKNELHFENFTQTLRNGSTVIEYMHELHMIPSVNTDVFDKYLANVKDNFALKVSQDLLIRVKRSLKSDHNEIVSSEDALRSCNLKFKTRLPKLMISKFMLNLQEIFEEMSALLEVSSTNLQILLAEGFTNVCELFVDICPFVFKVNIERDPRQNSLFHNNCLYFAYLVEGMLTTHKPLLDEMQAYLPAIRSLSNQVFKNQMQYQEKILLCLINDTKFNESLALIADEIPATDRRISSESHYEFRQCLNNCLKHLNALHRAFDNVLPDKVCGRAFNTLISSFLNEFVQSILSLNDISSLGAAHLSHELDYFSKELKQFLPNSEGLVSKWIQLNEVNFILKSSMLEIVNRWADGSGVLAHYLTADEVKHLIRALFQNNERRSNALSKIK